MLTKSAAISVSSVSDGTNSYTLGRTSTWDVNTYVVVEFWYCKNAAAVSSGATVTANLSAATSNGDSHIHAGYVAGADTSAPLDKVNSASTGGSTTTTPASGSTGTLTQAKEVAFGAFGGYTSPSVAPAISESSGFTQLSESVSSTRYFLHIGYQIVNSTSALNYQPTVAAFLGADVIVTFKDDGIDAAGKRRTLVGVG